MSNAHHTINLRNGLKMGDGNIKDSMIVDGLWCAMNDYHVRQQQKISPKNIIFQKMNKISLRQNLKIDRKCPKKSLF